MSDVFGRCERCGGHLTSGHTCPDRMLDKYISMDVPTISSLQKEIETLREQMQYQMELTEIAGRDLVASEKHANEWKRRAMRYGAELLRIDKSISKTEWFEEE